MKFCKCECQKASQHVFVVSPQRAAAARRAVQAEKDSIPLFPEMVKHKTAEERLQAIEHHQKTWQQQWRDQRAADWRRARAELRSLPPSLKAGALRYWQSDAWLPRDPGYLIGLVYDIKIGRGNPWRKLRIIKQFKLIAQGRLPRTVLTSIRAWDAPKQRFNRVNRKS